MTDNLIREPIEASNPITGNPQFKGEVLNYSALPTSGNTVGDIYFTKEGQGVWGINRKPSDYYIWTGTDWRGTYNKLTSVTGLTFNGPEQVLSAATGAIIQTALDLKVAGPVSAVVGNVPIFSNTNGKEIADSGLLATDIVDRVNAQTIAGRKTFADDRLIIDSPNATGDLEFGWFDDLTPEDPNAYGVRRSDLSGYFAFMPNANFPQFVMGSPTGTGAAFIDVTNNRPLNLNVLDTGVGTPSEVVVGVGGLGVGGVAPDASAIADFISTTQGISPPELTTAQVNAIVSPKESLFLYDTDLEKFRLRNGSEWRTILDGLFNEAEGRYTLTNELAVGTHGAPREASLGGGDSYTEGRKVYVFDGVGYTNESASSSFTIPNNNVNTAIYISTEEVSEVGSLALFFENIKVGLTTASSGGEWVLEYFNGAWVDVNHMSYSETGSYNTFQKAIFERTGDEQINIDCDIVNDWTTNDDPSSGTNSYWIRARIVTAITTAPVFDLLKIGPGRFESEADGFGTFKGTARPIGNLFLDTNLLLPANASPANQDVFFGANLASGKRENLFENGAVDRSGLLTKCPEELDTSCKVKLRFYFISDATGGSINLTLRHSNSKEGDNVYYTAGAAPGTAPREQGQVQVVAVPGTAFTQFSVEFELDVSDFATTGANGPDIFWFSLERDGGADSHTGDVALEQMNGTYIKWAEGGHQ